MRQTPEPHRVLGAQQPRQGADVSIAGASPKRAQRCWIHPDDAQVCIELDNVVEGPVDESCQLRFARVYRPLRPQAPQLGCGAPREYFEDRDALASRGHHLLVHHGKMTQDGAVDVGEGHPHVAHGPHPSEIALLRKEFEDPIGVVNEAPLVEHHPAGRSVDGTFVVLHPLIAQAKGQRPQRPLLWQVLGDPGPMGAQRSTQILDEGREESLPGLAGRPLQDHAQRRLLVPPDPRVSITTFHEGNPAITGMPAAGTKVPWFPRRLRVGVLARKNTDGVTPDQTLSDHLALGVQDLEPRFHRLRERFVQAGRAPCVEVRAAPCARRLRPWPAPWVGELWQLPAGMQQRQVSPGATGSHCRWSACFAEPVPASIQSPAPLPPPSN